MRQYQTAFAVYYPFDRLTVQEDSLEDAKQMIRENQRIIESGDSPDGDKLAKYSGAYIVIWTGEEWERYYD